LKTEIDCIDRWLFIRSSADDGTIKQIKGNWTTEEDLILKQKVEEYGLKKWKEIATFLPGRIGKQCRERWYNNVDPNLNKEKWTVAEDI
jgi:myb proto-oncogene protein